MNERGVVAILFVGLFALAFGMFVGYKNPGIFSGSHKSESSIEKPVTSCAPADSTPKPSTTYTPTEDPQ
jgi:hypothetical protein